MTGTTNTRLTKCARSRTTMSFTAPSTAPTTAPTTMATTRPTTARATSHAPTRLGTPVRRSLALAATLILALASVAQAAESTASRLTGVVNLNTANADQLQMLPGVGEKRAHAIIEIRTSKGAFKKVEDITLVKGVGESLLERLRPHLAVSGKTTAKHL
jgi:competence protein ComEA